MTEIAISLNHLSAEMAEATIVRTLVAAGQEKWAKHHADVLAADGPSYDLEAEGQRYLAEVERYARSFAAEFRAECEQADRAKEAST